MEKHRMMLLGLCYRNGRLVHQGEVVQAHIYLPYEEY